MRKLTKRSCIIVLAAAMTMTAVTGCAEKTEEKVMSDDVFVETAAPKKGELVLNNSFIGSISPQEAVYVVPFVAGEVTKNYVKLGDTVKEGDTLCKIDDEVPKLQLASAQATYQSAQANANQALGSSMDLQYIQMEANRDSLARQKADYEKQLSDARTDLSQLQQDESDAKDKIEDAKESYEGTAKSYAAMQTLKAKLDPVLAPLKTEGITSNAALSAAAEGAYQASGAAEDAEDKKAAAQAVIDDTSDPAITPMHKAAAGKYLGYVTAQETLSGVGVKIEDLSDANLALLKSGMEMQGAGVSSSSGATASLKSGITSLEGAVDQYKSAIDQTQAGIDVAQKTAEVTYGKTVEETKAIIAAQLNAANIGVQSAQMQLDMYTLKAPISGTVEAVNVSENGLLSNSNPAYVISNNDSMTVTFYVSEDVRNTFSLGQKIKVNRNGSDYSGAITEIPSMVDQQMGLFKIKAAIQGGKALLTGTSVTVTADTYRETGTLLIPYDAVYYEDGQAYVYCAEDGKAVKKEIQTGIFDDFTISVLAGLSTDSRLITSWSPNLRDGAPIRDKGEEAK